ncbi:exopolysaccharide transport family protein [Rhizobium sp. PAMB 3174]
MSGFRNASEDVDIDLRELFSAVWARRGRVLVITAAAAGLAFAVSSIVTPSYRAETRLLIESRQPDFNGLNQANSAQTQPVFDELSIASQVQVLQSADLIKQVAKDLKLYDKEEFDPTLNPSAFSDILVMIGLKKSPLEQAPEDRVLEQFRKKLTVYQATSSRVIGIQFESHDPQLASAIPNHMAEVYMAIQSGAKLDSNVEAARWLEPEIANLRDKVRTAEEKVAQYRAQRDLLPAGQTSSFAEAQLNDISLELARVRTERATASARAENVRSALAAGGSPDTLSDVVGSQMIQRLKEQEAGIQSQISDLSTTMLEGHPRLKALRAQLAGIRQQIKSETGKILASLENDAKVADLREKQLLQQLDILKGQSAKAGEDEVGLKALEREAAAQRQLLETYLARYREATSRSGGAATPADARVISGAVTPAEPYFPKVVPIVIVAAIAAFILSSVVIMLAALFSGRALKPVDESDADDETEQDEAEDDVRLAGSPTAAADEVDEDVRDDAVENEWDIVDPASPVRADEIEEERAQIVRADKAPLPTETMAVAALPDADDAELDEIAAREFEADEELPAAAAAPRERAPEEEFSIGAVARYLIASRVESAICISPSGDDGSTATVMLAREIAEKGKRVVLVDMTGSACPTRLMCEGRDLPGVTDLLCGEVSFGQTIHSDRLSSVHIIPQGVSDVSKAQAGARRLTMIMDALTEAYDIVIVECGPAEAASAAKLVGARDAAIVLSLPHPQESLLTDVLADLEKVGIDDVVLMSNVPDPGNGNGHSRAA